MIKKFPNKHNKYYLNNMRYGGLNYWRYNESAWGLYVDKIDNKVQIYEGEDLNGNGKNDTGQGHVWGFKTDTFESEGVDDSTGSAQWNRETEPNSRDTDGDEMGDAYEVWYSHIAPWKHANGTYILDPTIPDADKDSESVPTQSGQGCEGHETSYNIFLSNEGGPVVGAQGRLMKFHPTDMTLLVGVEVYLTLGQNTEAVAEIWNYSDIGGDLSKIQPVARRELYACGGPPKQPLFSKKILGESSSPRWYRIDTGIEVGAVDYYLVLWYVDADVVGNACDPDPGFYWWGLDKETEGYAATYDYTSESWDQEDNYDLSYRLLIPLTQPDGLNNYREYLLGTNPKSPDTDSFNAGTNIITDDITDGQEVLWSLTDQGTHDDTQNLFTSWDDRFACEGDKAGDANQYVEVDTSSSLASDYILDGSHRSITLTIAGFAGEWLNVSFRLVSETGQTMKETLY
jgi:hypothetical protein